MPIKLKDIIKIKNISYVTGTLVRKISVGGGGGGPPAFVEDISDNIASANSDTLQLTIGSGNFGIVTYRIGTTGQNVSVSDDINGSWTEAISRELASHGEVGIFYRHNMGAGLTTVTISFSSATSIRWAFTEYSGVASSNALDQTTSADGSVSTVNPGDITTTTTNQLIVVAAGDNVANEYQAGASYTLQEVVPANPNGRFAYQDRVVSSIGTYGTAFGDASASTWIACAASFKSA